MKDSRHIIWTDYLDYDDWKEDLEAQYPELSANERMNLMYEINGTYFQDEKTNLDSGCATICGKQKQRDYTYFDYTVFGFLISGKER